MIFASIRHNLANLVRFSGRESRALFWPWAIAVLALDVIATVALMVPEMLDGFARMQRFAAAHPEQATVESGPGHYSITIQGSHPELMPDMGPLFQGMIVLSCATVLLLAAAVARRLRDGGRRGYWGLLPLPFCAVALLIFPRLAASFSSGQVPDLRLFFGLFVNNLLYLASLFLLVVLLAGRSMTPPARFDAPNP